jgi:hypothetical protein
LPAVGVTREIDVKTILVIAHPGHELRIFRWMETTRPVVSILSDGSGGDQTSRTAYSTASIRAAKAECGPVFGRFSDKHWYSAMLAKDSTPFLEVVDDIVMSVRGETIATVVSDAVDGYNPLHDLTEAIGAAVVRRLAALGNSVAHLVSAAVPGVNGTTAVELRLDASARNAKCAAVKAYLPLAQEAQRILRDDPESLARNPAGAKF